MLVREYCHLHFRVEADTLTPRIRIARIPWKIKMSMIESKNRSVVVP